VCRHPVNRQRLVFSPRGLRVEGKRPKHADPSNLEGCHAGLRIAHKYLTEHRGGNEIIVWLGVLVLQRRLYEGRTLLQRHSAWSSTTSQTEPQSSQHGTSRLTDAYHERHWGQVDSIGDVPNRPHPRLGGARVFIHLRAGFDCSLQA
jgi:hypothetical protein